MTARPITRTIPQADSRLAALFAVFLAGAALVFIAGFAGAETLHATAHDTRHATGFPCH